MTKSDKPTNTEAEKEVEFIEPKDLIRRGLMILREQIKRIEEDAKGEGVLSPRMAKMLTDYIKTAIAIEKDIKDLGDLSGDALKNMQPEKIKELALQAIQELGLNFNK